MGASAEYIVKLSADTSNLESYLSKVGGELKHLQDDEVLIKLDYDGNIQKFNQVFDKVLKMHPELTIQFQYDANEKILNQELEKVKELEQIKIDIDTNNVDKSINNMISNLKKGVNEDIGKGAVENLIRGIYKRANTIKAAGGKIGLDLSERIYDTLKGTKYSDLFDKLADSVNLDNLKLFNISGKLEDEINKSKAKIDDLKKYMKNLEDAGAVKGGRGSGDGTGVGSSKEIKQLQDDIKIINIHIQELKEQTKDVSGEAFKKMAEDVAELNDQLQTALNKLSGFSEEDNKLNTVVKTWRKQDITKTNERYTAFNSETMETSGVHTAANVGGVGEDLINTAIKEMAGKADGFIHSHPERLAAFSDKDLKSIFKLVSDGITRQIVTSTEEVLHLDMSKVNLDMKDEILSHICDRYDAIENEEMFEQPIYKFIDKLKEEAESVFSNLNNSQIPTDIVDNFKTRYNKIFTLLKEDSTIDDYYNLVDETIKESLKGSSSYNNATVDVKKKLRAQLINLTPDLQFSLNQYLKDYMQKAFQEELMDVFSNPKYLLEGVSSAIALQSISEFENSKELIQIGQSIGEAVIKGVRKGLDAHSDSRESVKAADDEVNGIVHEIDSRLDDVEKAGERQGEALVEGFKKSNIKEIINEFVSELDNREYGKSKNIPKTQTEEYNKAKYNIANYLKNFPSDEPIVFSMGFADASKDPEKYIHTVAKLNSYQKELRSDAKGLITDLDLGVITEEQAEKELLVLKSIDETIQRRRELLNTYKTISQEELSSSSEATSLPSQIDKITQAEDKLGEELQETGQQGENAGDRIQNELMEINETINRTSENLHYLTNDFGELLIAYRGVEGTNAGLSSYRKSGTFWTNSASLAGSYGNKIESAHLIMNNPFEINVGGEWNEIQLGKWRDSIEEYRNEIDEKIQEIQVSLNSLKQTDLQLPQFDISDDGELLHFDFDKEVIKAISTFKEFKDLFSGIVEESPEVNLLIKKLYDNFQNLSKIDFSLSKDLLKTDEVVELAKILGHDGVIFKNIRDGSAEITDVFVTINEKQIDFIKTLSTQEAAFQQALEELRREYSEDIYNFIKNMNSSELNDYATQLIENFDMGEYPTQFKSIFQRYEKNGDIEEAKRLILRDVNIIKDAYNELYGISNETPVSPLPSPIISADYEEAVPGVRNYQEALDELVQTEKEVTATLPSPSADFENDVPELRNYKEALEEINEETRKAKNPYKKAENLSELKDLYHELRMINHDIQLYEKNGKITASQRKTQGSYEELKELKQYLLEVNPLLDSLADSTKRFSIKDFTQMFGKDFGQDVMPFTAKKAEDLKEVLDMYHELINVNQRLAEVKPDSHLAQTFESYKKGILELNPYLSEYSDHMEEIIKPKEWQDRIGEIIKTEEINEETTALGKEAEQVSEVHNEVSKLKETEKEISPLLTNYSVEEKSIDELIKKYRELRSLKNGEEDSTGHIINQNDIEEINKLKRSIESVFNSKGLDKNAYIPFKGGLMLVINKVEKAWEAVKEKKDEALKTEDSKNELTFDTVSTMQEFEQVLSKIDLTKKSAKELIQIFDKLNAIDNFNPQDTNDVTSYMNNTRVLNTQLESLGYTFDSANKKWIKLQTEIKEDTKEDIADQKQLEQAVNNVVNTEEKRGRKKVVAKKEEVKEEIKLQEQLGEAIDKNEKKEARVKSRRKVTAEKPKEAEIAAINNETNALAKQETQAAETREELEKLNNVQNETQPQSQNQLFSPRGSSRTEEEIDALSRLNPILDDIIKKIKDKTDAFTTERETVEGEVQREINELDQLDGTLILIKDAVEKFVLSMNNLDIDSKSFHDLLTDIRGLKNIDSSKFDDISSALETFAEKIKGLHIKDNSLLTTIEKITDKSEEIKALAKVISAGTKVIKEAEKTVSNKNKSDEPDKKLISSVEKANAEAVKYTNKLFQDRIKNLNEIKDLYMANDKLGNSEEDEEKRIKNQDKINQLLRENSNITEKLIGFEVTSVTKEEEFAEAVRRASKEIQDQRDIIDARNRDLSNATLEKSKDSAISSIEKMQNSLGKIQLNKFTDNLVERIDILKIQLLSLADAIKNVDSQSDLDNLKNDLSELNSEFNKIQYDKTLSSEKLAAQSSLEKLSKNIEDIIAKNTKMGNSFKQQFEDIGTRIKSAKTIEEVEKLKAEIISLETELIKSGKAGKSFFDVFANRLVDMNAKFFAQYFSFQDMIRYAREAFEQIRNIDSALIELKKVSDASTTRLQESFSASAKTAQELGSTINDVINITADWSRLGYSIDDAEELARVTTLFKTVGDNMTAETASQALISTLKGYEMGADEALSVIDKYNEVNCSLPSYSETQIKIGCNCIYYIYSQIAGKP